MISCVYCFINKINNKRYIGKTVNLKKRINRHRFDSNNGSTTYFHKAIRKYGINNFNLIILFRHHDDEWLKLAEKYYIKLFDTTNNLYGYNITKGGDGCAGRTPSIETREKIRQSLLGKKLTEQRKQNMKEAQNKKVWTPELRAKMSRKGPRKPHSEETKQKLRKPKSEQAKQNMRHPHKVKSPQIIQTTFSTV